MLNVALLMLIVALAMNIYALTNLPEDPRERLGTQRLAIISLFFTTIGLVSLFMFKQMISTFM